MNTTVTINLANTFFYMDEDAYKKLQSYLNSIKKSFDSEEGCEEIMSDIEIRIAELFTDKLKHDRQVIGVLEVDEIIAIMGQPEDYVLDKDSQKKETESNNSSKTNDKKLFRDGEDVYIGGVISGLGHYLGIEPQWARLIALLLFLLSAGSFTVIYILMWIFIPEAKTTSEKLSMRGKPINISNIEQKIKEGLDDVTERVKNVDYEKAGNRFQNGLRRFFNAIGKLLLFFVRSIRKIIGILLLIVTSAVLISLLVGFFSTGTLGFMATNWFEINEETQSPIWLISVIGFILTSIPVFFLFLLGSKIVFKKTSFVGATGKLVLLGIWFVTLLGGIFIISNEFNQYAFESSISKRTPIDHEVNDTLWVKMIENTEYENRMYYESDLNLVEGKNGEHLLYLEEVSLSIKQAQDTNYELKIEKSANGNSFAEAREIASKITYKFETNSAEIRLNDYFVTDSKNRFHDQEVNATLYIPKNQLIRFDSSVKRHLNRYTIKTTPKMRASKMIKHLWKMDSEGNLDCVDCQTEKILKVDYNSGKNFKLKIDENGIELKTRD